MAKNRKNIIIRIQDWIESVPGQTFLNYAYSWGAAVVILGALFKLTHIPGANAMLFIGMGTEVLVFFISGFDRPDALLEGVESRTSSPVRIVRDQKLTANMAGIYPCGEGAGYAGGITSAAMDGIKVAETVCRKYAAIKNN